jgi:hypothetical protein
MLFLIREVVIYGSLDPGVILGVMAPRGSMLKQAVVSSLSHYQYVYDSYMEVCSWLIV